MNMKKRQFEKNLKLLREFADEMDVPVRFYPAKKMSSIDPHLYGFYHRQNNTIGMRRGLSREMTIYILAHEIGHAVEWNGLSEKKKKAYGLVYGAVDLMLSQNWKISPQAIKFMLDKEKLAYELGDQTLNELRIELPKELMREIRTASISSYDAVLRGKIIAVQRKSA